ncbi:MAG: hypothetical protein HUJ61_02380 [Bacilli bacterium]|nr:hypothetical protein [Bacilli bacterium]
MINRNEDLYIKKQTTKQTTLAILSLMILNCTVSCSSYDSKENTTSVTPIYTVNNPENYTDEIVSLNQDFVRVGNEKTLSTSATVYEVFYANNKKTTAYGEIRIDVDYYKYTKPFTSSSNLYLLTIVGAFAPSSVLSYQKENTQYTYKKDFYLKECWINIGLKTSFEQITTEQTHYSSKPYILSSYPQASETTINLTSMSNLSKGQYGEPTIASENLSFKAYKAKDQIYTINGGVLFEMGTVDNIETFNQDEIYLELKYGMSVADKWWGFESPDKRFDWTTKKSQTYTYSQNRFGQHN